MVDLERLQTLAETAAARWNIADRFVVVTAADLLALVRIAQLADAYVNHDENISEDAAFDALEEALKALGGTAAVLGSGGEQQ